INYENVAASRDDRINKRIVIHAVETDHTGFACKGKFHLSSGQSAVCSVVDQQLRAAGSVNTNRYIQLSVRCTKLTGRKRSDSSGQLNLLCCEEATVAVVRKQKQIAATCAHKNVGAMVVVEVTNLEEVSGFGRR